ncbi:hypothetical protein FOZ63_020725 [Perkinsus olseni]|uniref:Uncharacterized protein n=1 Tax=Perkinsus olseni TaxID=32597 RepID=A0A7J6UBP5_PEROL|nr:hypothetical protein FOZ63_020725 [Perkinsus olseni]
MSVMEMVAPSIMWRIGDGEVVQDGKLRNISWYALGCSHVDALEVWLLPGACSADSETMLGLGATRQWPPDGAYRIEGAQFTNVTCRHLSLWEKEKAQSDGNVQKLDGLIVPESLPRGEYCLAAVAEFDKSWNRTESPDPNVPPWSHLVNSRVQDHYSWQCEGPSRIEASRRRLYVATPSSPSIKIGSAPRPTEGDIPELLIDTAAPVTTPTKAAWQPVYFTMVFLRMPSRVPMTVVIDAAGKRGSLRAKAVGNQRVARGTYLLALQEFGDRTNRGRKTELLTVDVERRDQSIDEEFSFGDISGAELSGRGMVLEWYPRKLRTGGGNVADGGKDYAWAVIPKIAGGIDPQPDADLLCEWSDGQGYVEVVSKDVEGVLCGVNRTRAPVEVRADCCTHLLTAGEPFGVSMDESKKLAVNFRFGEAGRSACRACSAGDKLTLRLGHSDYKECVLGRFSAEDSELAGEVDCSVLKAHIGSSVAVTGVASNFAALLMIFGALSIVCCPLTWCIGRYRRQRREKGGWRRLGGDREMAALGELDDEGSLVESPLESPHGGVFTDSEESGISNRGSSQGPKE